MTRNTFTKEQAQWLAALESGEWRQARESLWRVLEDGERGYCCLGVAQMLLDPNHSLMAPDDWDGRSFGAIPSNKTIANLLLDNTTGRIVSPAPDLRGVRSLVGANDDGATFAEIAAYIRKYPWAVFTNFDVPEGEK